MKTETHSTTPTRPTLPINRAFVVQFRGKADLARGIISGRVEHVQSGQATIFESLEALLAFIACCLSVTR
jgi:hypothetical protein